MKIIVNRKKYRSLTLRITEKTMQKIDEHSKENKVSRQSLIETILEKALNSEEFVIEVSKIEVK